MGTLASNFAAKSLPPWSFVFFVAHTDQIHRAAPRDFSWPWTLCHDPCGSPRFFSHTACATVGVLPLWSFILVLFQLSATTVVCVVWVWVVMGNDARRNMTKKNGVRAAPLCRNQRQIHHRQAALYARSGENTPVLYSPIGPGPTTRMPWSSC